MIFFLRIYSLFIFSPPMHLYFSTAVALIKIRIISRDNRILHSISIYKRFHLIWLPRSPMDQHSNSQQLPCNLIELIQVIHYFFLLHSLIINNQIRLRNSWKMVYIAKKVEKPIGYQDQVSGSDRLHQRWYFGGVVSWSFTGVKLLGSVKVIVLISGRVLGSHRVPL